MADTSSGRRIRPSGRQSSGFNSTTSAAPDRNGEAGPSRPRASRASASRRKSGRNSTFDTDSEHAGERDTPSKSKRRAKEATSTGASAKLGSVNTTHGDLASAVAEAIESTEDAEAKQEREKKERELYERWAEEYFEIVDQLPLELHRTFTLMRELENKVHNRLSLVASQTLAYRDARMALKQHEAEKGGNEDKMDSSTDRPAEPSSDSSIAPLRKDRSYAAHDWTLPGPSSDADAEGEIDEEMLDASSVASPTQATQPVVNGERPVDQVNERDNTPQTEIVATRAARLAILGGVARACAEATRAADEKVGLAVTAYEWVDRHIRRLDADLQKSESSLLLGLRAGTEASRGLQDALGLTQPGEGKDGANGKARKDTSQPPAAGVHAADEEGLNGFVGDMAIDPNEPKYCYCDQVSFGDMIACDNEDCPREWYHYECVGLSQPPKGKWFCLFCAPPGYKGSGTFPPHAPCLPSNLKGSHAAGSGRGRMAKREGNIPQTQTNGHGAAASTSKDKKAHATSSGNASRSQGRSRTSTSGSNSVRVPKRKA